MILIIFNTLKPTNLLIYIEKKKKLKLRRVESTYSEWDLLQWAAPFWSSVPQLSWALQWRIFHFQKQSPPWNQPFFFFLSFFFPSLRRRNRMKSWLWRSESESEEKWQIHSTLNPSSSFLSLCLINGMEKMWFCNWRGISIAL